MKAQDSNSDNWGELSWSSWIDLDASLHTFQNYITRNPGFYRIKSPQLKELVYIGQTGRNLRERTRALARGTYSNIENPPWNDPHTAAPLLWAYRHENKLEYKLSVASSNFNTPDRQCYEDYLLYLHHIQYGYSTLTNHGRAHPHWTRPTNKGKGLSMKRRSIAQNYESIRPAIGDNDFAGNKWLDLEWSKFERIENITKKLSSIAGVYRIKRDEKILYIGESKDLKQRIRDHSRKTHFKDSLVSVHVMPDAYPYQLKEREADLIGAYYLSTRTSPEFQYNPYK